MKTELERKPTSRFEQKAIELLDRHPWVGTLVVWWLDQKAQKSVYYKRG